MEIVPRLPSERVVRSVLGISVALVFALSLTVTLGFAESSVMHVAIAWAFGVPLALVLTRPLMKADAASRVEGSLDRFEHIAVAAGKSLFIAGLLAVVPRGTAAHVLGVVALVFALALVSVAMWRDRIRARFLRSVYAKEHPGFRVERDRDVHGYELLPPVLSGMITDAVIAHVAEAATYRTSGGPRPIARVTASLAKMMSRLDKRSRVGAALAGVLVMATPLVMTSPLWHTPVAHASLVAIEVPVAPSCAAAGPYFEDRLEAAPGIGRAALLTTAQDETIAAGDGVLLIVPDHGGVASDTTKARALAIARAIPCSDPLAITVADPNLRAFHLDATLTLEPDASESEVLRDADEQVRELFEPNVRAVYNEHFGFGATEKMLGYRARYALKRVPGVKSVHLIIDGDETDAVLGPRDFPTLASLTLHSVR